MAAVVKRDPIERSRPSPRVVGVTDIPAQWHKPCTSGPRTRTSRRAKTANARLAVNACRTSAACAIRSGMGERGAMPSPIPMTLRQACVEEVREAQTSVCVIGCLLFLLCRFAGRAGLRGCRRRCTYYGRRQFLRLLRLFRLSVTVRLTFCHDASPILPAADATVVSGSLGAFADAVAIYFRRHACRCSGREAHERQSMLTTACCVGLGSGNGIATFPAQEGIEWVDGGMQHGERAVAPQVLNSASSSNPSYFTRPATLAPSGLPLEALADPKALLHPVLP